jgi:hypothetical protein
MYNYTGYVNNLSTMLVVPVDDPNFVAMLPNFIDAAELGCYRDLDLLDTVARDNSANLTANSRDFTLPSSIGRFVKLTGLNVITPVGATPSSGTRNQLLPAARELVDYFWPNEIAEEQTTVPTHFAMVTSQSIIVAPSPGAAFNAEVVGTIRPTPLSSSNTTTILTLYLPDLFLAASMKFGAAYMKNFGAAADDPRSAQTWSTTYDRLLQSAQVEEFCKKFAGSAWTSTLPSPLQPQPPRN